MNRPPISYCPCTLAHGFSTYSPAGLRLLFDRRKVSHLLDFSSPKMDASVAELFRRNSQGISVSGAQFKQSLTIDKNKLRLTQPGEAGHYILKPIPFNPPFARTEELPANEHLTMQIARQVFGLNTGTCGLVFFQNGEPAYLARRFDYAMDGQKIAQEDFASISGRTRETEGVPFKNKGSYEDIARLMKKYVAAYPVEVEKYFSLVLFNYLFSNGDAHLKNFSLQQTPRGDYLLSPAYDLINTAIHIPSDSFFALEDGLFSDDFETDSFRALGFYAYEDFFEFGIRIGMKATRIQLLLSTYSSANGKVFQLTQNSFLSTEVKELYLKHYQSRCKMLGTTFKKEISNRS